MSNKVIMSIEGNIGAGKTTLSKMIAEDFNAKLVLERFAETPLLEKLMPQMSRYKHTLKFILLIFGLVFLKREMAARSITVIASV